jgi:hypothetical protein
MTTAPNFHIRTQFCPRSGGQKWKATYIRYVTAAASKQDLLNFKANKREKQQHLFSVCRSESW